MRLSYVRSEAIKGLLQSLGNGDTLQDLKHTC